MALTKIDDRGLKTPIDLLDNEKIRLGTGNDLELYHDGTQSQITESGTGLLYINSNATVIRNSAGNENQITAEANGSVGLYYDNKKSLETRTDGVSIKNDNTETFRFTGHILSGVSDSAKLYLGSSDDLQIYHDGSNSYIKDTGTGDLYFYGDNYINFANAAGTENKAKFITNGAVELYYDGVKTFSTDGNGIFAYGPEGGTANVYIYADEGDDDADKWSLTSGTDGTFTINNRASGSFEKNIECNGNGNVELYYDNSKKLETITSGVRVSSGDLELLDNTGSTGRLLLGNGGDLQLYHDGSSSYVYDNGTGPLILGTNNSNIQIKGASSMAHMMAEFKSTEGVELYYNNTKTFQTEAGGITVTGTVWADGLFLNDNENMTFGASSDFTIHHNANSLTYFDNALVGGRTIFRVSDSSARDIEGWDIGSNGRLYNNCKSSSTTSLTLRKGHANADGIDYFQCRSTDNTGKLYIAGDGDVTNVNNSYGQASDSKLKENIVDASSQWDDIKGVKVRNFNFKSSTGLSTHKQIGVVAQEIETVSAGLVKESIDRDPDTNADLGTKTKQVKYSVLYMKAIKALQEAMAKIETLETKVAALEAA